MHKYDDIARLDYIERCDETSRTLHNRRVASKLFRGRSACSKEEYFKNQIIGQTQGMNIMEEEEDDAGTNKKGNFFLC